MKVSKILGLVTVFTAVVLALVFLLNPSEGFKARRDQQRVNDLATLKKAIDFYLTENAKAETTVSSLLCEECSLSQDVYSYRSIKVGNSTTIERKHRYVNSTGWVPIDFSKNMKIGQTPIKDLPLDPLEDSLQIRKKFPFLSNFYPNTENFAYTFTPGKDGKYKLTALMESKNGLEKAATDGGTLEDRFEIGSDLQLAP